MKIQLLFSILIITLAPLSGQSVEGLWKTIDDETGKAKAHVSIFKEDTTLKGKVVELLQRPNAKCKNCEGTRKNQPVLGMEILWGLKKNDEVWENGEILDPNNGRIYSCKLWLKDKNTLVVRGFLGFSLLGRSQIWHRIR